jgi:hypothetical protein
VGPSRCRMTAERSLYPLFTTPQSNLFHRVPDAPSGVATLMSIAIRSGVTDTLLILVRLQRWAPLERIRTTVEFIAAGHEETNQ